MQNESDAETLSLDDEEVAALDELEELEPSEFQAILFLDNERLVLHVYNYYIEKYGAIKKNFQVLLVLEWVISEEELDFFVSLAEDDKKVSVLNHFCAREE